MTSRSIALVLATALAAGSAGWFAARHLAHNPSPTTAEAPNSNPAPRKILFYQSAMHPWIKSDKPGKCTICGMELTPVFEGDTGIALDPGLVALGSNAISVLHVRSTPVRIGPLVRTLRVAGVLNDDTTRRRVLSAWVGGRIDELFVNFTGAEVAAGQPLVRFYSPMLLEAERQFLALHSQTTSLPATERSLLLASAVQRLHQLGLADSQIDQLHSKSPTNIHSELLAPASGTVVERFVFPGQYVMEGEKLFEIADFSSLWFLFDAYEQDLPFLQPGQEIELTTASAPGQTFQAPIRFIDPNLTDMTRSAKVRVEVPNPLVSTNPQPRRAFPHRGYAEGRARLEIPNLLLVPRSAVLSPSDRAVVYLDKGAGVYEQRPVQLGRFGDDDYEVLAGLSPEDPVVVQGNLLIDAQAQLNQTVHAAEQSAAPSLTNPDAHPPHALPELSTSQIQALQQFLNTSDALRATLAADDLAGFRTATTTLPSAIETLRQNLATPDAHALQALIPKASLPTDAPDLRTARKAYHAFSVQIVALARQLRTHASAFKDLKVYRCPMTAEAFDGAPARAEWLQPAPPLRNPWFGADMLECGVEVRD